MTKLEFSVSEIDSLSKQETCFKIFDFGGKIHAEIENLNDKTKIIGNGYGGWKIHAFFNDSLYYKTLNNKEKRKYDDKNTCRIIRADYSKYISFEDGSSEKEILFLYFSDNDVFYIKYENNSTSKNQIKETIYHNFFLSDIHMELADKKFLEEYLVDKKNEIMKVWNNRR